MSGSLVTVPASMTLRALNAFLAAHGLALPNLGDIDAQTVAGALATGTHGTGSAYGCLSTFVHSLTLVDGRGSVVECRPGSDLLAAASVGLGALGVVTSVTLSCVPAFVLHASDQPAPLDSVLASWPEEVEANDHFEFYWFPYTTRVQVKRNNIASGPDAPLPGWRRWLDDSFLSNTVYGAACRLARSAPSVTRPLMRVSARALSARTYTAASHEVFCTPRRVRFVEMEYGLPRAALPVAFAALREIVDRLPYRIAFPVEVRFTAPDDLWLSHGYGRENAYVAIHQYVGMPYRSYFDAFETVCRDLSGRPHWGKMNWRSYEDLRPVYPRLDDFRALRDKLDPDRVFRNDYVDRVLGP